MYFTPFYLMVVHFACRFPLTKENLLKIGSFVQHMILEISNVSKVGKNHHEYFHVCNEKII